MSAAVFGFFVKQKTAYVVRIRDWSSDVCSSDLPARDGGRDHGHAEAAAAAAVRRRGDAPGLRQLPAPAHIAHHRDGAGGARQARWEQRRGGNESGIT